VRLLMPETYAGDSEAPFGHERLDVEALKPRSTKTVTVLHLATQPLPHKQNYGLSSDWVPTQAPRAGCEVTLDGREAAPADESGGNAVGQAEPLRRPLTLERLQEVAQSPPLAEDQLVRIAGNLCCCLTQVRSPARGDELPMCPRIVYVYTIGQRGRGTKRDKAVFDGSWGSLYEGNTTIL
jgi:hypothetical protein